MMKRFLLLELSTIFCLSVTPIGSAEPEPKEPVTNAAEDPSFWMRRKLELSKAVFGALASGDFATIKNSADSMGKLSQFEGFVRGQNPDYRTQLEIFRFANKELMLQAEKENIDGATLAFNQLTLSCVNCHKHLRSISK